MGNIRCNNNIDTIPTKTTKTTKTNRVMKFDKTIYNFNTTWCGYSVRFQPIWDEFTEKNKDLNINIIDVKCDDSNNEDLCNLYPVEGFPTVLKVKGDEVVPYTGPRTVEGLEEFSKN